MKPAEKTWSGEHIAAMVSEILRDLDES